jgi:drug/metabolite transporter (DMT)-like permease
MPLLQGYGGEGTPLTGHISMDRNLNSKGIMFYSSMIIAIISVVFYQVLQKNISAAINPAVTLIITYAVAIVFSVVLYFIFPGKETFFESVRQANYASYALGIAVIGIEIGFLLIYRSGWKIGLAAPFSSSITNILLITIGLTIFREHITGVKLLGVAFCIVGIILISMKQ